MSLNPGLLEALDQIGRYRLRTGLSVLGLVVGIAAVTAVVSLGETAKAVIVGEAEDLGSRLLYIAPNWDLGEDSGDDPFLTPADLERMRAIVPVAPFSWEIRRPLVLCRGTVSRSFEALGVGPEYFAIWRWPFSSGRLIDSRDVERLSRVALLGNGAALTLFPDGSDPVGKSVVIGGRDFAVVGLLAPRKTGFMGDGSDDLSVYVSRPVMAGMDGSSPSITRIPSLLVKVPTSGAVERAAFLLGRYLEARFGSTDGKPRFSVGTVETSIARFKRILSCLTLIVALVAGLSLAVSGIGIMNVMLVSVAERKGEIGMRKAIGARNRDLLGQFLAESLFICGSGGAVGAVLGIGLSAAVSSFLRWPPVFPLGGMASGLFFSLATAGFFGLYPAVSASRLAPVEALGKGFK
jgi:putative ABC transport system permease protein